MDSMIVYMIVSTVNTVYDKSMAQIQVLMSESSYVSRFVLQWVLHYHMILLSIALLSLFVFAFLERILCKSKCFV